MFLACALSPVAFTPFDQTFCPIVPRPTVPGHSYLVLFRTFSLCHGLNMNSANLFQCNWITHCYNIFSFWMPPAPSPQIRLVSTQLGSKSIHRNCSTLYSAAGTCFYFVNGKCAPFWNIILWFPFAVSQGFLLCARIVGRPWLANFPNHPCQNIQCLQNVPGKYLWDVSTAGQDLNGAWCSVEV